MKKHHSIDYIEMATTDMFVQKDFYHKLFGWEYTDYGPDYCAFVGSGIEGGFDKSVTANPEGVRVIFYSDDLEQSRGDVVTAGGEIHKDIFSFPGGRRFHFLDPSGNHFAIWSDKEAGEN